MLASLRLRLHTSGLQATSVLVKLKPVATPASFSFFRSFNYPPAVMSAAQDGDTRVARIKESIRAIPDWPKKGD